MTSDSIPFFHLSFSVPDERKLYVVNFYDKVLTNESTSESTKKSISVTCCKENPNIGDVKSINVSCGLGKSCASQCTEQLAHLCPTGNCTGDFEDCIPDYQTDEGAQEDAEKAEEAEEQSQSRRVEDVRNRKRKRRGRFSPANLPSWVLSWCSSRCGIVWKRPICCFNPICWRMNLKSCNWLQNYSGKISLQLNDFI